MLKKLLSALTICAMSIAAHAQELNCTVKIIHDKIQGVDPQVFTSLQRSISDFMNTHRWTNDDFATSEKIDCNFLINLTAKLSGDNDGYTGTISITATRPVFNSSYTSPTVNYVDKDVTFHYTQFSPLEFDETNIGGVDPMSANLMDIMAFYSYLIIGLDYDSFSPEGGTVYLKKAQYIVNNAPEQGSSIKGWKAVDGTRNRFWIIDDLLNSRFDDVRTFWYKMHREGLDNMYAKPAESRDKIMAGIPKLVDVNKENPSSVLIQFFFDAKSDEFLRLLAQTPKEDREKYINMLSALDVPNANKYATLR
jgi:hypothetical protein